MSDWTDGNIPIDVADTARWSCGAHETDVNSLLLIANMRHGEIESGDVDQDSPRNASPDRRNVKRTKALKKQGGGTHTQTKRHTPLGIQSRGKRKGKAMEMNEETDDKESNCKNANDTVGGGWGGGYRLYLETIATERNGLLIRAETVTGNGVQQPTR